MIGKTGGVGIAVESNCAVEFIDGRLYRVIRSNDHARAYRVLRAGDAVRARQIRQDRRLQPVEGLWH